jgi:DNA polymerase-3 subunit alpha
MGAKERYKDISPEAEERINFELFTIRTMGFAGYFLIVADFIRAGRDMGVFIGPGRGSAAGSVVAYCTGITNIDPLKYNLLFERFLNPDRKSMPDIDTDFDDAGRQKVIDYVVDKYGKNQVAQIITYGSMAARTSIQDVGRVLDMPLSDVNALKKLVPETLGINLKTAIEQVPELQAIYKSTDIKGIVLREAENWKARFVIRVCMPRVSLLPLMTLRTLSRWPQQRTLTCWLPSMTDVLLKMPV